MTNLGQYIPHMHNIFWMAIGGVVAWRLSTILDATIEAISEPGLDGKRGKVSIKRIIPFIFTILLCYMVIGCMHSGKEFNVTAFWGLLFYIALATTVITYAQATGLLDKINMFKNSALKQTQTQTTEVTKTENSIEKSQTERTDGAPQQ